MTCRVTFLAVMPSPYMQDLFDALSKEDALKIKVLYMEQEAPDTHWGQQAMPAYAKVLNGGWISVMRGRVHINPSVMQDINKSGRDLVLVMGYSSITSQLAMYYCIFTKIPWIFWGETPGMSERGNFSRMLRKMSMFPIRYAKAVAAIGKRAREEYTSIYSNHVKEISNISYYCRTDTFKNKIRNVENNAVISILYCGQIIERKGVDLLCSAFHRLCAGHKNIELVLVGEGDLLPHLKKNIANISKGRIIFKGFKAVEDLPDEFINADVFVLPSRHDGWGVVINQAIASGLPIITTDAVGAAHDLVEDEINGLIIQPDDENEIYKALEYVVENSDLLKAYSIKSLEKKELVSLNSGVRKWCNLVHRSCKVEAGAR